MENRQFNRTYELILGKPESSKGLRILGDEAEGTGLQLQFTVKKNIDNKEKSNTCEIKLTNLSEDSIKYIHKKNSAVILKVGYANNNKILFSGMTTEIITDDKLRGSDRVTTLRCIPANSQVYSPTLSKTFPANTTPRTIINYLIGQSTALAKSSFNSTNIDKPFPFGYPIEGSIKQILNELARDFDFHYRIDGNRVYVNDVGSYQSPNSVERAFVISPGTGLIGAATKSTSDGKKLDSDSDNHNGVKFKAQMNALLQPGQAVKIQDTAVSGTYRVNTAEFSGDWRSGDWDVTCHCSKITAREL